jgi:hypothetical protein
MTKAKFIKNLGYIFLLSLSIIIVAALDYFIFDPNGKRIFTFMKEMSVYVLLCITPYVAYIFSLRQKFIEKIETEWRRVVEIKSDIMDYTYNPKPEKYSEIFKKLSCAIDNMRCIYKNVGQDRRHIGYYPFETLHDFRRALESINPSHLKNTLTAEQLSELRRRVDESFKAFRDIFLIEIDPPEPELPIILRNMSRLKEDGVSEEAWTLISEKQDHLKNYFGVTGEFIQKRK